LNQVTVTKTKKTKRTVTQPLQLGVVIVTYNSADALRELLDSLEQALAGIERTKVLIVDNLSSDNSVEIGERHPLAPTVIRNSTNAGYSAAINIAAGMLPPEADMLILNPDIRLLPGSVAKLLAAARSEDVVPTDPTPPVNSVPPTTTEAMANSSQPTPSIGCPAPNCAARMTPASPARPPLAV